MAVKTKREREEQLKRQGLGDGLVEMILKMEGPHRHQQRVLAARKAAREALPRAPWLPLFLDILGVGGRMGLEGRSTRRLPPFEACGKGRKQATDGRAWNAAIEAAFNESCYQIFGTWPQDTCRCAAIKATPEGRLSVGEVLDHVPGRAAPEIKALTINGHRYVFAPDTSFAALDEQLMSEWAEWLWVLTVLAIGRLTGGPNINRDLERLPLSPVLLGEVGDWVKTLERVEDHLRARTAEAQMNASATTGPCPEVCH
jgi:hypothetical protein